MTHVKPLILAGLLLVTSMGVARAEDDVQVWRDSDGQIVRSTSGACVRSSWDMDTDPCASARPVAMERAREHTIIASADRTVYFDFDKSELTADSKARLDALAERIKSANDVKDARVVGYADRIGTASYNEKLSKKRAEKVRDYLIMRGVVTANVTETRWVGKTEPTASCASNMPRAQQIECLQPDRKVQVEIDYRPETQARANY